jgi:hypothetical protein
MFRARHLGLFTTAFLMLASPVAAELSPAKPGPAKPSAAKPDAEWSKFAEGIGAMIPLITNAPMPQTEQVQAEGFRHLARLLSNNLERALEGNDASFPRLLRMPNSIARIGWDNPDNVYLSAPVRGDHTYRIRGNIGTLSFISFNVYNGFVGKGGKGDVRAVGSLDRASLKTDAQGNYEIIMSPDPHPGNWIKLSPNAQILTIREVFGDWNTGRQGPLELVNLTTQGTYPKPFTAEDLAQQLQRAVHAVVELRSFFNQNHARLFQKEIPVNSVSAPTIRGVGLGMDDPKNNISAGHFQIKPDEALILTVSPSQCEYNNIPLGNLWWETFDYANHQSHLNGKMTKIDADGKTRYVIARLDPGAANWLDTAGHDEGTLFVRWTVCSQVPARVDSQVVKLSQLKTVLPRDTEMVTAEQRKQAIDLRQRVVSRRLAGGG